MLACLDALQQFVHIAGRKHSSFTFTCGMFESVKLSELTAWLKQQYYLRIILLIVHVHVHVYLFEYLIPCLLI